MLIEARISSRFPDSLDVSRAMSSSSKSHGAVNSGNNSSQMSEHLRGDVPLTNHLDVRAPGSRPDHPCDTRRR